MSDRRGQDCVNNTANRRHQSLYVTFTGAGRSYGIDRCEPQIPFIRVFHLACHINEREWKQSPCRLNNLKVSVCVLESIPACIKPNEHVYLYTLISMSSMRVKLDWVPLSSLQGRCCGKLVGRLSSQHLALRSVCEHMGPLVPPPGGLPPDPHWCDLTGARASPPWGPITTQAPEQIAQCLRTLLYGRWFLALFPEHAETSKSCSQTVVLTLGFPISNLPRSWILGRG